MFYLINKFLKNYKTLRNFTWDQNVKQQIIDAHNGTKTALWTAIHANNWCADTETRRYYHKLPVSSHMTGRKRKQSFIIHNLAPWRAKTTLCIQLTLYIFTTISLHFLYRFSLRCNRWLPVSTEHPPLYMYNSGPNGKVTWPRKKLLTRNHEKRKQSHRKRGLSQHSPI